MAESIAEIHPNAPRGVTAKRNRQIVEGALFADIAIVLLLGRVYLPIPVVRTLWRLLAATPFLLLAQRQGIKVTIMSGIVAYALLSAMIGPLLALSAIDTSLGAVIIATGLKMRLSRVWIALLGGLVYGVLDVILPTIFFTIIFRIPVSTLISDVRNALLRVVDIVTGVASAINSVIRDLFGRTAPIMPIQDMKAWGKHATIVLVDHWVLVAIVAAILTGVVNIAAYHSSSDLVIDRLPEATREDTAA